MVRIYATALSAVLLAGAYSAASQPASSFQRLDPPVQSQFRFNSNIVAPRYEAIRSERAWRGLWAIATTGSGSVPPRPEIDFGSEMLLVAAMGAQPRGGYTVNISGVRETQSSLVVTVVRNWLGRGCGAIAAVTEPADVVRVRASQKPLRWVFRDVRRPCT